MPSSDFPIGKWIGVFSWFMTFGVLSTYGCWTASAGDLVFMKIQPEQSKGNQPISSIPLQLLFYFVLQVLALSSFPEFPLWWTGTWMYNQNNPFAHELNWLGYALQQQNNIKKSGKEMVTRFIGHCCDRHNHDSPESFLVSFATFDLKIHWVLRIY